MNRPMFRETLWFKRGELDDEAMPLPIEDRYLDDASVSGVDTFEYGVHCGETAQLPVFLTKQRQSYSPSELAAIARELKGSRRPVMAAIGASIVALTAVLAFFAF